jgi:hypothetical protein
MVGTCRLPDCAPRKQKRFWRDPARSNRHSGTESKRAVSATASARGQRPVVGVSLMPRTEPCRAQAGRRMRLTPRTRSRHTGERERSGGRGGRPEIKTIAGKVLILADIKRGHVRSFGP